MGIYKPAFTIICHYDLKPSVIYTRLNIYKYGCLKNGDAVSSAVAVVSLVQAEHMGHYITRRAVLVDDYPAVSQGDSSPVLVRLVRSDPYGPKPKSGAVTGPVYTFVKTDPYAHFKWGVRHVAGVKYAGQ